MTIPMTCDDGCAFILTACTSDTPFRTGGWSTVIRDERITHYHTNLYTGALSLEDFAAEVITIMRQPGQTPEGAHAAVDAL